MSGLGSPPFPYQVDDVLHPLFQARHAQFPYFELDGFLCEHLAGQAHGGHSILPLRRLLQELLVELLQVAHCQCGCISALFEINDVLCHVVQPDKIMMTNVGFCRCCKSEVEGCLDNSVMVRSRWRTWSTYTLHLAE